jgi:hypothetical protein
VQGGLNYGRTSTERCDIREAIPEYAVPLSSTTTPTNPWCDFTQELFRATALGSYIIPKIDVQIAGAFRSDQGDELAANWTFGQADTVGLNRTLAGGSTTASVNLIEPGTLYGDRVNQFDLRFAKIPPLRRDAHQRRVRRLQRLQREPGAHLRPGIHPQPGREHVAPTEFGPHAPVLEVQRAGRLLIESGRRRAGLQTRPGGNGLM